MATAPKLINAFTTPFFEAHLENAGTLNNELRTLFIEREQQGDKYRNPYMTPGKVGLFESDFDLFRWTEQPVQKLRSFCMDTIGHVIASLNGYDRGELARLEIINHTWFHITRKLSNSYSYSLSPLRFLFLLLLLSPRAHTHTQQ